MTCLIDCGHLLKRPALLPPVVEVRWGLRFQQCRSGEIFPNHEKPVGIGVRERHAKKIIFPWMLEIEDAQARLDKACCWSHGRLIARRRAADRISRGGRR